MTDTQILTLIIGITFPVLGLIGAIVAVLYSNKRMDDFRGDIGKRLDEFKADMTQRIDHGFEHMELLLALHEEKHHK